MKLIYICSPFRGDTTANVRAARQYCRNAFEQGHIPVAPHLYLPQFLNDDEPKERDLALRIGLRLIDYCSEVWVHGDVISPGMRGEIEYAMATSKKVIYLPGAESKKKKTWTDPRGRDLTELEELHDSGDPRYWSELRKLLERESEEYRREEERNGVVEDLIDEDAAIADLY